MQIYNTSVGPMGVNIFLILFNNNTEAVLIDAPKESANEILAFLEQQKIELKAILLTHGHYDHVEDAAEIKEKTNALIYAHKDTVDFVEVEDAQAMFGASFKCFKIDNYILDNQILEFGEVKIKCLYAPGHCAGSIMYYIESEKKLFAGDVIFQDSVGRCDLPTGSFGVLQKSIRNKIYTLPDDTEIHPGHGFATNVAHEKQYNPYVTV